MKPVQYFLGNERGFLKGIFYCMRHRIPAATMPHTRRNHLRKPSRIPSLHRKGGDLFVFPKTTCAMLHKTCRPQGFLWTILNWSFA